MNKNYKELITDVVDYIERQINEPIDLEILSKQAGLSKYHLHRIFKSLTSKSLIEYVRERKLACSLKELLNTDLKIIDIAFQYGFNYEQCYIRAFKEYFGISPAKFRVTKQEVQITPKIDPSRLHMLDEGFIKECQFIMKPGFQVLGIKYKIYHEVNLKEATAQRCAIDFFDNHMPRIKYVKDHQVYIGLVKYSERRNIYNYYITATEVEKIEKVPDGLTSYTLHDHQYAVFKYIGFHSPYQINYEKLISIYEYIFVSWQDKALDRGCASFHFERINLADCKENYCEMEFFFPT